MPDTTSSFAGDRLAKVIARAGLCSRRDAELWIKDGRVAVNGKVIIATLNGEMLIRRLEKTFNKIRLVPETPRLSAIDVDLSGAEFSIWGVVTYVIHSL